MPFPTELEPLLADVLARHRAWEAEWPPVAAHASLSVDREVVSAALVDLALRLRENYPHFHPLYAGQMLKPPHPAAVLGHLAAELVNPNNHALDGGRATARLEKEAVAEIARMFGLASGDGEADRFLGHLTASGTIANLEALWVAREERPGLPIAFSRDAHYTHKRVCGLLGVRAIEIDVDPAGRLDLAALDRTLSETALAAVVVTLGTTGLGALDPLPEVLERRARHGFRVHADAAYGGYFRLLAERPELAPLRATAEVDSLVVDPHKHGLQPYGCGCVLFRDGGVSRHFSHASPYTYFSSPDHHPGETTFECSRAGAAAAALWLTQRVLPLGEPMRAVLAECLAAARELASRLAAGGRFGVLVAPVLDIVCYFPRRATTAAVSAATEALFRDAERADEPVYLAKLALDSARFAALAPDVEVDSPTVTVLRSVLMRPEQRAWVPELARRLEALVGA